MVLLPISFSNLNEDQDPKLNKVEEDLRGHRGAWQTFVVFVANKVGSRSWHADSNWGLRWWRNWIEKKRDSSCKISNETVAGIEILFKEKDLKYLEFLFVYYMDAPIRKDHVVFVDLIKAGLSS